jgi:hypothetical protein
MLTGCNCARLPNVAFNHTPAKMGFFIPAEEDISRGCLRASLSWVVIVGALI